MYVVTSGTYIISSLCVAHVVYVLGFSLTMTLVPICDMGIQLKSNFPFNFDSAQNLALRLAVCRRLMVVTT